MTKKILLVVRWPVGGIRTYVRYVYRLFDPEEWRFTILAPDLDEMRVLLEDLEEQNINFVPVAERPSPAAFTGAVFRELVRNSYDLVHSHGFTSGICTALPAKLTRTPHIMTSHDVLHDTQFPGMKGKLKKACMSRLFAMIDTIQSVSHDAQSNLIEYFPTLAKTNGKCIVIPNGIEVERFVQAEPRDLRKELGLSENDFLIGFLGRFMAQKGFRYLVDAIDLLRHEDLPKRPLVLAFGEGGFVREEKQAIKDRGLEDYFRFMPFTPNVAGTIKGLDVVTMPSLWEACPLQPMEALVCGTPLIGTNCIGLREVLKGTPSTIIGQKEIQSLAEAIKKSMTVDHNSLFASYKRTAIDSFDITKTKKSLTNLYCTYI